jgi:hypothetical protein
MMDIKIHKIVPKLKGLQNLDTWIEKFEIAPRNLDIVLLVGTVLDDSVESRTRRVRAWVKIRP